MHPETRFGENEAVALEAGMAVRALVAERPPEWVGECARVALTAEHGFVRGEARIGLQIAPPSEAVAALLPALLSENRRMRRRAMTLLPRLEPEAVVAGLASVLPEASVGARRAACVALAAVGRAGLPLLKELAEDSDAAVARRAARAVEAVLARGDSGEPGADGDRSRSSVRPFGLLPPVGGMPERERSFAVAAFNFSYGVNLGTLIRSAEAAGAEAVWIVGRDFYYRPSAKGADWWIPVEVLATPAECLERARAEGFGVVALQQGERTADAWSAEWPERPLIVVGNEGDGLPSEFAAAADLRVELPVWGEIDSLNASVAASVAMYAFRAWQARTERVPRPPVA